MPARSERQRKAAMRELIKRKVLGYQKEDKATRSFGAAEDSVLIDFSKKE